MTGTNNNDYAVDISLNDGGTLDQILKRLQAIDSQIAQTVVKATEFTGQMNRMHSKSKVEGNQKFDKLRGDIEAAQKALRDLNKERELWAKSGSRTVDSAFGNSKQTAQLKAQMDTFKRLLKEPFLNAGTEIENQLKKLQKQQMLAFNALKKQQVELERMQVIRNLGTSPYPGQFLRGRSQAEIVGLGAFAKSSVGKSLALGDKDAAIIAQKAIDVIKSTLADQLAPAVKERLKIATGLIGNQASIKSFVEQNSKQEVKETVKALRKQASTLSTLEINNPQARDSAKLAEQLTELSRGTKLSVTNLNRITREITTSGTGAYSGKSTNELTAIRSAITSEFGKAVRDGRSKDAEKYELAANRIGTLLDTINNPTRAKRLDALRATANAQDFNTAFSNLVSGKSKSGLEQLLGDAKGLYNSDKNKFGEAEELRKLVVSLQQMLPKTNIRQITKDINSSGFGAYSGKSSDELMAIRSAIKSEFNKAVREGRKADATQYETASNKLGGLIDTISNPTRSKRYDVLRAAANAEDFKSAFGGLTAGKSQSGLEQLLADAKGLYRADKDKYGEAEELRKLVAALKELVTSTNKANGEAKQINQVKPKTPNQELAAFEALRVSQLAGNRYAGGLLRTNMQSLSVNQLDLLSGEAKLAQKAQELRVARAKETQTEVQAEVAALNLLRQQTRELEDQLRIKKQLESQERRRNSPDVIQAQARAAAEAQAARNSPEAIRQSILRDISRNEQKRQIDNGADMFSNQAMLLRNYAIMGAGVGAAGSSANYVVQLDKGFAQLQSILALTNNDMEEMKSNLIEISELTKFDTVQVVDAGVMLGQAGLSKDQIQESLTGITLFATAVGTDLASAVDLATSAVGVFNIQASRMPEVVDKLTIAINKSKLNMDKLSLGLQYAGNIAEQSNVSFDETVAALAAMANSGIKSGSTLGTGLRQILITLQKPSEAFIKKIQDLGLSMSDLDLNTHSLVDIMGTLSGAGFTVVDAMQTMEVRTASAFSAFSNNLDVAKSITKEMRGSGAAAEANAVQMQALANQWERFASIAKSIVYNALEPLVMTMTELLRVGGDILSTYSGIADVLELIVLGLTTIQGMRIAKGAIGLLARVAGGRSEAAENVQQAVQAGGRSVMGAMTSTDKAAVAATLAPWILRFLGGPAVMATGLGLTVAMAVGSNMSKNERLNAELDKARFRSGEIQSRQEITRSSLMTVDSLTNEAFYRRAALEKADSTAMEDFVRKMNDELKHLGFYMEETKPAFDTVISKLQDLRTTLTELSGVDINRSAIAARDEKDIMISQLAGQKRESIFTQNLGKGSFNSSLASYNGDDVKYRTSINLLKQTNPELAVLLDRKNANGLGTYTSAMSKLSDNSSAQDVQALQIQNKKFLAALQAYILENPKSQLAGLPNSDAAKADTLLGEIRGLVRELENDYDNLGNISTKFGQMENARDQRSVLAAANQVKTTYEKSTQELLMKIGNQKTAIREGKDSPLSKYEQLSKLNAEALEIIQKQNTEVRNAGKNSVQKEGLDPKALGEVLDKTGLPGAMNQLMAELRSDLRDVSKAALKDKRKRVNKETSSLDSQIENLRLEQSEATDPKTIKSLGERLKTLIERKSQIEQELSTMEAMISENPDQLADVTMSIESKRAQELDTSSIATQRQLAKYQAMQNFRNGQFTQPIAGETNNREIAQNAKQYFALFNNEIKNSLIDAQTKAETLREFADGRRANADDAVRRANDQGLPYEFQQLEVAKAIGALRDVFEAIKRAIDVERNALLDAIQKDSKQLDQLRTQEASLKDGNPLKAAMQTQMVELEQNIAQSQRKLADLHRDEVEASRQNIEAAKILQGELELRYNSERPYLRESKRRTKAMIYGTEFRTDEQIRNGEAGQQIAPKATGLGDQMSNLFSFSTKEASKAYEGFDALSEAAEGLIGTISSLGDTAGNFFSEFARGNMSASDAVKGFASTVVGSLADMAMKIAANQIMMMILSTFMGGLGGATSDGGGASLATGPTMTAWTGGPVRRFATGGLIVGGRGSTPTRDSTLVHAAPGEYVLRSRAVKALGLDTVNFLNQQDETSLRSMKGDEPAARPRSDESGGTVNIWIVSEDEKPQSMDENSTLVIIDKALKRNSSTRKLVRQISMGEL